MMDLERQWACMLEKNLIMLQKSRHCVPIIGKLCETEQ